MLRQLMKGKLTIVPDNLLNWSVKYCLSNLDLVTTIYSSLILSEFKFALLLLEKHKKKQKLLHGLPPPWREALKSARAQLFCILVHKTNFCNIHDEPNQANFAVLLVTGYLPKIYIINIIFIYY